MYDGIHGLYMYMYIIYIYDNHRCTIDGYNTYIIYYIFTYIYIYMLYIHIPLYTMYTDIQLTINKTQLASALRGDFGSLLGTLGPLLVGTSPFGWLRNYGVLIHI